MQMCVKEREREWATGGAKACEIFLLCCVVGRRMYSFYLTNFVNQCVCNSAALQYSKGCVVYCFTQDSKELNVV